MEYASWWQDDLEYPGASEGIHPASAGSLGQDSSQTTRQLSQGILWFLIATALFLAVLDERLPGMGSFSRTAGWVGLVVLYYRLRPWLKRSMCFISRQLRYWSQRYRWRYWRKATHLQQLVDLLVISAMLAHTGGWTSPLYMLYLGWAVVLVGDVPTISYFWLTGVAGVAFVLGCLLAFPLPPSALHITMIAEHLLVLLVVSLGTGLIRAYINHLETVWERDHQQWEQLRQVVFAHLSHELYTPLSAINASASLLAVQHAPLPAAQQRHLVQVIQRNCSRMMVLVDDLLEMWRVQRPQVEIHSIPVRCLPIVESVAQTLAPLLEGRQLSVVIRAEQPDVCVLADPRRLEQVLVNLLANAQKYAPAGTTITLTIARQHQEVLFAVHDEGAGVPFEQQCHLFEPFYRGTNAASSSRGAGIGLALARELVIREGGRIWVESMPGQGSTFYFTLPSVGLELE